MTKDEMLDAIVAQRRQLIETVGELSVDEWNTMSMCAGWKVRDVVGHLVSILEIPLGRFLVNVVKARNFDRYADQVAREIGRREPAVLVASYQAVAEKRFSPPVVGPIAPLADVYIHTRDIERPLGKPSRLDPQGLCTIVGYLCGGKARGFIPSSRTKGLRFEATDIDWSIGDGPVVRGTGEAIMMAASGRRSAVGDLAGDGVESLAKRLAGINAG